MHTHNNHLQIRVQFPDDTKLFAAGICSYSRGEQQARVRMWETKAQLLLLPEGSSTVFASPGQVF